MVQLKTCQVSNPFPFSFIMAYWAEQALGKVGWARQEGNFPSLAAASHEPAFTLTGVNYTATTLEQATARQFFPFFPLPCAVVISVMLSFSSWT